MAKQKSTYQAEPDEANDRQNDEHQLDPVIDALLEHLPAPGDPFPDRKLWLQILELVLQLVYPEETGTDVEPNEPPAQH